MDRNPVPPEVASELVTLFDKAESVIKTLELLYEEGLFYHPVNQLRYAGYHIARALDVENSGDNEKHCKRAISHCQRAIYDASEMAIVFCLSEVHGFQQDYKSVDFLPTIPNYPDIVKVVRQAQVLISKKHKNREQKYKECGELFKVIKPYVDCLNDARPELNKRLNIQRLIMSISVGTLIVGVISLLIVL